MKTVPIMRQRLLGATVNSLLEVAVQNINAKYMRALAVLVLVCCGVLVYGQGTSASLTGYVTDPSGAAIPGAAVTVTNLGTNFVQAVKTDSVCAYPLRT